MEEIERGGDTTDDIPLWKDNKEARKEVILDEQLDEEQQQNLRQLTAKFTEVMSDTPGRTDVIEHDIETGTAHPIQLPPYRLPHAYRCIEIPLRRRLQKC